MLQPPKEPLKNYLPTANFVTKHNFSEVPKRVRYLIFKHRTLLLFRLAQRRGIFVTDLLLFIACAYFIVKRDDFLHESLEGLLEFFC